MWTDSNPRSIDPVLVIGASRSGTSLMTRVLAANGFEVGADCSPNFEAWCFQRLNRWLLLNAGGGLETPDVIDVLLADPLARRAATAIVRAHAQEWAMPGPACFKDPRTTFTLPIWLDIFPDAKVIHMLRHGVDVAHSLVARRRRVDLKWADTGSAFDDTVRAHMSLVEEQRVVANLRMSTLSRAFRHWEVYVARARQHEQSPSVLTVRYEDLLQHPDTTLARVERFVGRPVWQHVEFDPARAFAHRQDPTLVAFAYAVRMQLGEFGYA